MNRITQEAKKRQAVVKLAKRKGQSYASRMYNVSLSSVKRWCKRYDGTWQSLKERSHRPHSHPRQHTEAEESLIRKGLDKAYFRYGWEGPIWRPRKWDITEVTVVFYTQREEWDYVVVRIKRNPVASMIVDTLSC